MNDKPARLMTDDELASELERVGKEWDDYRKDCEHSGSPGEWMLERMDEIQTEQRRRLISLDGDIGRRNARS